jgi:GNAT superfamily N-acetyltransferase
MKIVDFSAAHVERATQLAKENYQEERGFVPALPPAGRLPDLVEFAKGGRGVALEDGGGLLGFFCWYVPMEPHFGLCKGTWSPMHAHGSIARNRAEIYDRLYQAAAEKLVPAGVLSHSATLYSHDAAAIDIFFQNGFGGRCVDAIRETLPIAGPRRSDIAFRQAKESDAEAIAKMNNSLIAHLNQPPIFLPYFGVFSSADIENSFRAKEYQYLIAHDQNDPVAYLRLQATGENFACDDASMMNISGAYAKPTVRGKGVMEGLLSYLMDWLRDRGYSRCGVDFESFNFTARKFWLKYFTAYTISVVRRIDERICGHVPNRAAGRA